MRTAGLRGEATSLTVAATPAAATATVVALAARLFGMTPPVAIAARTIYFAAGTLLRRRRASLTLRAM